MRLDENINKSMFTEDAMVEEIMKMNSGETPNQRMVRVPVYNLNSINPDLKFATESQEDFPEKRLPTLDSSMKNTKKYIPQHTSYQKNMKTTCM